MIGVLCVSIGLCLLLYFLLISSVSFLVSLSFLSLMGCYWLINFDFDEVTFGVVVMLLICFFYAYYYTGHYFGGSYIGFMLLKLIVLFVSVMGVLVCTGDYLCTLIFWEYLGVVSFFLILFYDSFLSLRSSIITLVSSRFGDLCLFVLIGLSCYIYGGVIPWFVCFFFIIFSKSAGYPFISWLLEAMRAPTPVSSLVHSSTLVAAGVWFVMRYDYLLHFSWSVIIFSTMLLLTVFVTGVSSLFFLDLKKIVALSTCNNISWCVLYLIFGDVALSLFQLISHGVSKCILFMLVGDVMTGSGGSQASNCVYSSVMYGSWNLFGLFAVILGLSGVPFIGVFFTKHFLISTFLGVAVNVIVSLAVGVCVFLSYLYSFRLCSILCSVKSSLSSGVLFCFGSGLMVYCWLFVNFYVFFLIDEVSYLSVVCSVSLVFVQFLALWISVMFCESMMFSWWSSSLFGCDNLVEWFYEIFYNILFVVNFFFVRWDYLMVVLFHGVGRFGSMIYGWIMLNIFLFSMLGLLSYVLVV
uniref:NADH:ubiquinone reductase (H(+)-translocating) n=2 Tax=Echinococcus granulosus sensu lato genotype G7 TaxID=2212969 RepID=A0A2Z4GRZ6_9CEST|nr:NADH dehydrogenase subunit 5 [Echinococcus granulosus sensu lato genotype G7]AWW04174.1 NADH dehydrogenase subunit 5 [Echinococcus granulosus sensu lato genotype G7]AWW04186.1 NADH dehydrogenase subunit 5 [Echinococcus granulosus sensu lato genotype G7]AWW04198.1 NADH dehydrogenase subunit 5 [Echinococcus granulosus sensu lato genotype G7]AWW04210.1 NADH dehydrogenase subunit 5 [Echinococcus granulosus sensu lato genotype G7]